jgi:uncharacterized protein (AIM24 family)
MSHFEIVETEGMRYVRIRVADETVRAESGALSYMTGQITMQSPLPGVGSAVKCLLSDEPLVRPSYSGTGEVYLQPSFHGYHVFELDGEAWILENGAYWASDGSVELGLHRERIITSFWAGEGFIDFQTRVSGHGRVVLNSQGPIREMVLHDDSIAVEGKLVVARTAGLDYSVRRPSRSIIGYWLSGENLVRVYQGTGKVLMAVAPFWTHRFLDNLHP